MSAPTMPMTSMPAVPYTPARSPVRASEPSSTDDVPTMPIYRLTVEQYHQMIEAGILKDGDPVELVAGWLLKKMTKYRPHTLATRYVRTALERLRLSNYYVEAQEPITSADSEPEPDVSVIRGIPEDYKKQPPTSSAALVVEVAESSLKADQGLKLRAYARASVPMYWIVNLIHNVVEVYGDSDGTTYTTAVSYLRAAEVPVVIDGREVGRIPVNELLPRGNAGANAPMSNEDS